MGWLVGLRFWVVFFLLSVGVWMLLVCLLPRFWLGLVGLGWFVAKVVVALLRRFCLVGFCVLVQLWLADWLISYI